MSRRDAREALLALMYEFAVNGEEGYDTLNVMEDVLSGPLSETDRNYIKDGYNRFAAHREQVDSVISSSLTSWDISRLAKVDLSILRLAVSELLYSADIPAKVSINEAVELAKKFSSDQAPKFINGVLAGCFKKMDSHKLA